MKKTIGIFGVILLFSIFITLGGCDHRTEKKKLVHKDIYKVVAQTLWDRYQLRYFGTLESGSKEFYDKIGMYFRILRVLNKDEGREILINSVEELLKEINSDPKLKPYLSVFPFDINNVEIKIFSYYPDVRPAYYPDTGVFAAAKGKIRFSSFSQEQKSGYYTNEEETYEEALKIVNSTESKE